MGLHLVAQAFLFAVVCGFVHCVFLLHQHRSKINKLRNQGMPMPKEWSWVTGHLFTLWKYKNKFPRDAFVGTALAGLAAEFSDTEAFLMDLWPIAPALLIVYSPELSTQIATKYNLPKEKSFEKSLEPITGGPNMITMNGEQWKTWRTIFNPGFSEASMQDYVPHVIRSVEVFCELLDERITKGEVFCLGDLTMRLTADVITKLTLNANIDCQLVQTHYNWRINEYIGKELQKQFMEHILQTNLKDTANPAPVKSIASLIRLFLFAGSDTTSSSIIYTYHLLSQHPGVLEKLRAEHTAIFGPHPSKAATLLKQNPTLLNKCRYTMAVIKETLRLYAPAATMRAGGDGIVLSDRAGHAYPMDHISTSIIHRAVHFNPRVWPRPHDFMPERFLVNPGHELYPNPAAYRPFEQGPRACIGQKMVYNEMRIVLVLTARRFCITPAYEEWGRLHGWRRGWAETLFGGRVFGDRAYQTEKAGTHPKNGYPRRIEALQNE
ncbi:cytochrome P450 [Melanomma pulvis-pyrius CBS 109.77]|uniref:Cytochrome P450 n=1 Tax=Melanomma pulvis-pyrius CBS 109.77 TaxID=1314802 RepID=A0A6A6X2Y7_9PLEO|nr:cytochrome P450 [Melanomma pulvis-pyrius CBS 109.77]